MANSMHCALPSRSYFEALETAEKRALHSFFDQHVIEDDELGYFALDEGDYNILPAHLAARVVHTVHGGTRDSDRSRRTASSSVCAYPHRPTGRCTS